MTNTRKVKTVNSEAKMSNDEISRLRMNFAENNPEIIKKIFEGDPQAFELFTNFGHLKASVTEVLIREKN